MVFPERVTHFDVTVDLVADMATINPFDFFLEPEAEQWPFSYDPLLEQELAPFRRLAPIGPRLQALLDAVPRGEQLTVDMLVGLNRAVQSRVAYIVRMEPGVWTPEETLAAGQGSCRDSAWLLVQALRQLGYAARFVSGYLIQLVGDVKPLTGPEGPTADFTDLHAWAEAYLPGAGWVGLDATSGLLTGEGHIPLAATPDPQSAAAITGAVEKCETEFGFEMHVTRVRETPRVTKPYTEAQWQDILAMGAAVDRALAAGNVRLTMGGEPTFVSATDFDEPEWNTDALGPTKQRLAAQLMGRLRALWAPGSALQNVSGKHYPGEQLPRWAFYAHWREDGEPVWRDQALLATEEDTDTATPADAARFCAALAERLQVDPSLINPAYEDIRLLPLARAPPAGERGGRGREAGGRDGAGAAGARVRPWARRVGRLRAAAAPRRPRRRAHLAERQMVSSAAARCSWCPAIRPSASGCRWTACPGRTPTRSNPRSSPIRSPRSRPCRRARRCAPPPRRPTPWAPAPRGSARSRRKRRWSAAASPTWCAPRSASNRAAG